jgi:serine/threonine protein kinase
MMSSSAAHDPNGDDESDVSLNGVLSEKDVKEAEDAIGERCEEKMLYVYSTTAKWRDRATRLKRLAQNLESWSKKSLKELPELPNQDFAFICKDCDLCKAKSGLKERLYDFGEMLLKRDPHTEPDPDDTPEPDSHDQPDLKDMSDREIDLLQQLEAAEAGRIAEIAGRIAEIAGRIYERHDHLKDLLAAFKRLGNETALPTTSGPQSQQSLDSARFDKAKEASPDANERWLCSALTSQQLLEIKSFDQKKSLQSFSVFLAKLFTNIEVLDNDKAHDYSAKINVTVNAIIESKMPLKSYIPGGAQEEKGDHPILYAIMFKMAEMCRLNVQLAHEISVPAVRNLSARRIDYVASNVVEHMRAVLPAMLDKPIEIKPTKRKGQDLVKLMSNGANQVFGHLAKMVNAFFHLGGIGFSCEVSGMVICFLCNEVITLRLINMGTINADIKVHRTGLQPMHDRHTTECILQQSNHKNQNKIIEALFGNCSQVVVTSENNTVDSLQSVPPGLCLLANFLNELSAQSSNIPSNCVCYHDESEKKDVQVGTYLGSGAFCHVFKLEGFEDTFIKTPKDARGEKSLQREASILRTLSNESGIIPRLHVGLGDGQSLLGTLKVKVRCEESEFPCLRLNGIVGRSASTSIVKAGDEEGNQLLKHVFLKVSEALAFAHKREVIHLDVRPSNIIICQKNGELKIMLSDWGCAEKGSKSLTRFRGCPPYAHDSLLSVGDNGRKPWSPDASHDMASFAFSVAALHSFNKNHSESLPWHGFDRTVVDEDTLNKRRQLTNDLLEGCGLDREFKDLLIQCVALSKKAPNKVMQEEPQNQRKRKDISPNGGTNVTQQ